MGKVLRQHEQFRAIRLNSISAGRRWYIYTGRCRCHLHAHVSGDNIRRRNYDVGSRAAKRDVDDVSRHTTTTTTTTAAMSTSLACQ